MKWSKFKQLVDSKLQEFDVDDAEIEYFDFSVDFPDEVYVFYRKEDGTICAN